jgi:3-dehydroquinate dehydratase-2
MASRILVLHGPNLPRLLEREAGTTLAALTQALTARARERGAEVRSVSSAHEGALLEALEAAHGWADAVLLSPGVLSHASYALREALQLLGVRAVEVQVVHPSVEEPWRRTSLLADVVERRCVGGQECYFDALDTLLCDAPRAGQEALEDAEASEPDAPSAAPRTRKTLGRRAPATLPQEEAAAPGDLALVRPSGDAATDADESRGLPRTGPGRATPAQGRPTDSSGLLTRAWLRQKIGERLSGTLSAEGLAAWARSWWLSVQGGGPVETGQREVLEEALQALTLSAAGPSRMTDVQLLELMARLDR